MLFNWDYISTCIFVCTVHLVFPFSCECECECECVSASISLTATIAVVSFFLFPSSCLCRRHLSICDSNIQLTLYAIVCMCVCVWYRFGIARVHTVRHQRASSKTEKCSFEFFALDSDGGLCSAFKYRVYFLNMLVDKTTAHHC